jgi:hypothetical protein
VLVVASDVVPCEDSSRREAQRFDTIELGTVEVEAPYLTAGGLAVADLDGDGVNEIIRAHEEGAEVWSARKGTYVRSDIELDLPGRSYASISAADVDSDGDIDLFLGAFRTSNALLINAGDGTFTEEGLERGLGTRGYRVQGGAWGDPDGDGDLDLFIPAYGPYPVNGEPADPAEFFLNDGNGYFTDGSALLPIEIHEGYGFSAAWLDIDGDQQAELFSVHDFPFVQHSLLLDWFGGAFRIDEGSNFQDHFDGMGMVLADMNQDGRIDVVQTGFAEISVMVSSDDSAAFGGLTFMEYATAWGFNIAMTGRPFGWGIEVVDLDNNGTQEVLAMFGDFISPAEVALGYETEPMVDALWVKEPAEMTWVERGADWGLDEDRTARGVVVTDLNQDGWLDVVSSLLDGPTVVRMARCGEDRSLTVRLRQTGLNPDAIGAAIRVDTGKVSQYRWIWSGSRGMYGGETPEAHFGVEDLETLDRVEVTWPDGLVTVLEDVPSQQRLLLDRIK